ncbi:MAG: hypothetical protein ACFFEN_15805 [Candidatus Thorarchaeota archaeon]
MGIIDNLKKLSKNWRLTVILIWLLIGVAIIPFPDPLVSLIGIFIFLPFLVFLMFLFLLSLVAKKDIFEFPTWKIVLFLVISLPIMLLLSIILIILFAISIISYFFFTSWFILYGCYLVGKNIDTKLDKIPKVKKVLRVIIFFGGLIGAILLLYVFIIAPTLFDFSVILETPIAFPWYLNGVYILVGAVLVGLAIMCIIYMFKKIFPSWFGVFSLLITFYTLYLVLKIYLGIVDTKPDEIGSIWAYIAMIIPDLLIIFYSLSTLMGSQAELLSQRFKRVKLDTVIVWLILSKVAYEFIHFFPYGVFSAFDYPWLNALSKIDNDTINLGKNVAVLAFFIILIVIIGVYEIAKYAKAQKSPIKEVEKDAIESLYPRPMLEETSRLEIRDDTETFEDTKNLEDEEI